MAAKKKINPKVESERLETVAHELTIILNKSRNPDQITRVQRDLESISNRYLLITGKDLEDIIKVHINDQSAQNEYLNKNKYMNKIKIEKASPSSDNHEINLISSIIKEFENRYWNILSDRHTKMDFTNSAERDTFFTKLEELKRNVKLVVEYIEDSLSSQSQDYASKMRSMRVKQERILLVEFHNFFQEIKAFLANLIEDMDRNGNIVLNPNDRLEFTRLDDVPIFFRGKTTKDAIRILFDFVTEMESSIKLPNF